MTRSKPTPVGHKRLEWLRNTSGFKLSHFNLLAVYRYTSQFFQAFSLGITNPVTLSGTPYPSECKLKVLFLLKANCFFRSLRLRLAASIIISTLNNRMFDCQKEPGICVYSCTCANHNSEYAHPSGSWDKFLTDFSFPPSILMRPTSIRILCRHQMRGPISKT
jgi:hypothetical protein